MAELVSYVRKARELRSRYFDSELFGEPGWDILLDLYQAELAQRRVQVSNVCVGSGVPATTTLRWLKVMEAKGLIRRAPDPMDGRRVFISLSYAGRVAMDALFETLEA